MCTASTWREISVFKLEIFWQTRHRQSRAPLSVNSSIFSKIRSSSSRERKSSRDLNFLLIIFSFGIIVYSINVVPKSISGFGVFSTQVARDPRKFYVDWFDVPRHVIFSGNHLSTGEALPNFVSHVVFNLAHHSVDLRIQFFHCSVVSCKQYIITMQPHTERNSGIFMHCVNVASEGVSCLGKLSTEVATDARELDVRRFNVPRHVVLVVDRLATGDTLPYWLTKLVGALSHKIIDLSIKFFESSAIACKNFAFRLTAKLFAKYCCLVINLVLVSRDFSLWKATGVYFI